jgi:hypothetical protein
LADHHFLLLLITDLSEMRNTFEIGPPLHA